MEKASLIQEIYAASMTPLRKKEAMIRYSFMVIKIQQLIRALVFAWA
jgi:hypothetical protein